MPACVFLAPTLTALCFAWCSGPVTVSPGPERGGVRGAGRVTRRRRPLGAVLAAPCPFSPYAGADTAPGYGTKLFCGGFTSEALWMVTKYRRCLRARRAPTERWAPRARVSQAGIPSRRIRRGAHGGERSDARPPPPCAIAGARVSARTTPRVRPWAWVRRR